MNGPMGHLKSHFPSVKRQSVGKRHHGHGKIDGRIQILVQPITVAEGYGVVHAVPGSFVQVLERKI